MDQPVLRQPVRANAHRITPFLMVGASIRNGYGDPAGVLRELSAHGVTHILDCRSESSDAALIARHAPHVVYHRVGTEDEAIDTTEGWFEHGVAFVRKALADPGAVVLTHCALGQTRGPSMGFATLLDRGWEAGEAFRLITSIRPQARVGYAEHALRWHLDRTGASQEQRTKAQESLRDARRELLGSRHHGWR